MRNGPDDPIGNSLLVTIVRERNLVLPGLLQHDAAVDLASNIDQALLLGILSEEVLIPAKLPGLKLGLLDAEEVGDLLAGGALLGDGDGEVLVRDAVVEGLGAVDGGVDLDAEVEELAGEEVGLVGGEDAAEVGAGTETLEGLGRDDGEVRAQEGGGGAEAGDHRAWN